MYSSGSSSIVPMWGVLISFQNYSPYMGFLHSEWVGLAHFERLFANDDFYRMFRNTMAINVLSLVFFFPIPIGLSLMLNELRTQWFKKTIQSIVYLPHFLSWVIIVGMSFLLLSQSDGIINHLLEYAGLPSIDFLTETRYFWALLTLQSIWKEVGWGTVIFLRIGHIMDVGFEQVYLMMNGAVSEVAEVFDTYVYRMGSPQTLLSERQGLAVFWLL